jgi:SAM-dependent methyltransferase
MDSYQQNRLAWNAEVIAGNMWTIPVSSELVARARAGDWSVVLTPTKPVPRNWFGEIHGKEILGLASGGGQQCPIFAAAGARVTLFDASDAQLATDQRIAARDGLTIRTVQGNMRDLSAFADGSFDLVFNPCSTCFVDDVESVWKEVSRVLRPGGALLTGFVNPWFYLFDDAAMDKGVLIASNKLPTTKEMHGGVEFSHSFEAQLGGQLRAGLSLTDLYEDSWDMWPTVSAVAPAFMATRAVKK